MITTVYVVVLHILSFSFIYFYLSDLPVHVDITLSLITCHFFFPSSIFLPSQSSQVVFQTLQTATAAAIKMLMELADMPSLFFFRSFCQAFVDTLSFSLTHLRKKIHTIFHCRVRWRPRAGSTIRRRCRVPTAASWFGGRRAV